MSDKDTEQNTAQGASQQYVIAIDGPAASGKGTLARRVAAALSCAYMDTGLLYRAVGHAVMETGGNFDTEQDAVQAAQALMAEFTPEALENPVFRSDKTGQAASKAAQFPAVRETLLALQQNFARSPGMQYKGAVLDGRDIGTVVCPYADAKIFIIASVEERAKRRHKELHSAGEAVTYEAVLKDMRERDARDSARKAAPMAAARDAFILDTTALNPDQAFDEAMGFIREKIDGL